MNSNKKWSITVLLAVLVLLTCFGAVIVVIDPYFHYHGPLGTLQYPINNQRYQNDGIVKHFKYDAIITGTSMTENFKTSEFDALFGTNSIKVPFSGGSYKEINENLERAAKENPELKYVLRGLDYNSLLNDKDRMREDLGTYPTYLYDENLYNDVKYVFNKDVLNLALHVITYTKAGNKTTAFDNYSNWMSGYTFGKEAVLASYAREEKTEGPVFMTDEDYTILKENFEQNILSLARKNPQITFYLFFTPYSIYYWDSLNQKGILKKQLQAEKAAIELLLEYDNIFLFSFFDDFGMICNLNNYKDIFHYGEMVNSRILKWMKEGKHQITRENYQEYCREIYDYYTSYDYDRLFDE